MFRALLMNYLREQAKQRVYEAARDSLAARQAGSGQDVAPAPCDVAIVFAMGIEAGGLVDLLKEHVTTRCASCVEHVGLLRERRVVIVEAGVEPTAAPLATDEVISLHHVKYVISAGFAAALHADMKRGHFLLADEVVDTHGQHLSIDVQVNRASLEQNPLLHVGRLLSIDHVLRVVEEKYRLGHNHAALAYDMESLGIGKVCHQRNARFLSVRIITEALDDGMPKEVKRMLDQKSLAAKLGAAAGALWNRPSSIKDMWQLKEDAFRASDRLARFLAGVVANLPPAS